MGLQINSYLTILLLEFIDTVFRSSHHLYIDCLVVEDLLLQEDLIHMLPMVNEANAMSEELDKKVKFEVALIAPQARGLKEGRTEVRSADFLLFSHHLT